MEGESFSLSYRGGKKIVLFRELLRKRKAIILWEISFPKHVKVKKKKTVLSLMRKAEKNNVRASFLLAKVSHKDYE